jgi:PAS domain S-box-containing protein
VVSLENQSVLLSLIWDQTEQKQAEALLKRRTTRFHIALTLFFLLLSMLVFRLILSLKKQKMAMEETRQQKERLDCILDATSVGTWEWNVETGETHFNDRFAEITGYSREELQRLSDSVWTTLLHPDDLKTRNRKMSDHLSGILSDLDSEVRFKHKLGHWIWIHERGRVIKYTSAGSPLWMYGTHMEITQRKSIEESIKEWRDLMEYVIRYDPNAIAVLDKKLNFLFVSDRFKSDYDIGHQTVIGRHHYEVFPDLPEKWKVIHQRALKGEVQAEEKSLFERLDGRMDWTRWECRPWYLANGEIGGIILYTEVITHRKQMEAQLRDSEEKFRSLFASMNEAVALYEVHFDNNHAPDGYRLLDCNPAFSQLYELEYEQVKGKEITEIFAQESLEWLDHFADTVLEDASRHFITHDTARDKYFSVSVFSPGESKVATISSDITASKKFQQVIASKNKELESYLYVVSHDMRSPLVNVQGFSQRLQKNIDHIKACLASGSVDDTTYKNVMEVCDQTIPNTLKFIFTNVSKMDALLNGLLQVSRTGRVAMEIREIDMNAIKYRSPERPLVLTLNSTRQGSKVIYQIQDNGKGIGSGHLEKIWDVFYRAEKDTAIEGEGLGLSIVRRIAEKHQGRVWVESSEGVGTLFTVELPARCFSSPEQGG